MGNVNYSLYFGNRFWGIFIPTHTFIHRVVKPVFSYISDSNVRKGEEKGVLL